MTAAKKELFEPQLRENAALFKALAHPARLAILNFLAKTSVCMTGDISDELPLGRSTVNQHLTELKKVSLIKGEIEGVKVNYCLNRDKLSELRLRLNGMFDFIDNCC